MDLYPIRVTLCSDVRQFTAFTQIDACVRCHVYPHDQSLILVGLRKYGIYHLFKAHRWRHCTKLDKQGIVIAGCILYLQ